MDGLLPSLEKLLELTKEKHGRLRSIMEITLEQSKAILNGDIELLTKCIRDKQEDIDKITDLDKEFSTIYESVREELGSPYLRDANSKGYSLFVELRGLIAQVQQMVKEIYKLEEENNRSAKQALNELKVKIKNINVGKKGYTAYKKPNTLVDGVFIDKKK